MTRKQRTRILVHAAEELRHDLAQQIRSRYAVKTVEAPRQGLVMVKMRESARSSLFYLGEVLVTQAKVQAGGAMGLGIVRGEHAETAFDLAVIDAAYNAALPETLGWHALLEQEEQRLARLQAEEDGRILETKVSFETMDV